MQGKSLTSSMSEATVLFEDILGAGSRLRVQVTGKSMFPFLRAGDVVTIQKVPDDAMGRGDIIFFKNSHGFPVLHRLIKKKRHIDGIVMFQTKGDALVAFDEPVREREVLGKVIKIEKMHGATGTMDMESLQWRTINYLVTLILFAKSTIWRRLLGRMKRSKVPLNPT